MGQLQCDYRIVTVDFKRHLFVFVGLGFLLVAALNLFLLAPVAWAGSVIYTDIEAWYNTAPQAVCSVACPPTVPSLPAQPNPYPADTLHVSIQAGTQTAVTYLSLALPADKNALFGTLTLPASSEASDGAAFTETAHLMGCLVTDEFTAVQGSIDQPPKNRCTPFSPKATYNAVATSFTMDISPLLPALRDGSAKGIAIMPTTAAVQGGESWHVVFSAKTRAGGRKITADVTFASPAPPAATSPPTVSQPPALAPAPAFSFPPPTGSLPPVTNAAPALTPSWSTVWKGGTPQLVWGLPLAILVGFYGAGRLITREIQVHPASK